MKIIFIIGSLKSGGAERVATVISDYLIESGHDVTLVTGTSVESDFYIPSPEVKRVSLNFNYSAVGLSKFNEELKRFLTLRRIVSEECPDIIIASTTDIAIRFGLLKSLKMMTVPVIGCEHNTYHAVKSKFKRIVRSMAYRYLDALVVLTDREKKYYTSIKSKVLRINNPLGIDGGANFRRGDLQSRTIRLLSVGRLTYQKGYDRLILVAALLKRRKVNFSWDIVGDGELKADLQSLIDSKGLSGHVVLRRSTRNIEDYYENADVFVMTSRWEGLPMVIPEAMSFGLPIISFDCETGPSEILGEGEYGILVNEGNIPDCVSAILSMKSNDNFEKYSNLSVVRASHYRLGTEIGNIWLSLIKKLVKEQ